MKAFIVDRYKPKDRGRIADVPQPLAGTGQVLVQIHAAGVNPLDSKIMSGEFKLILPYRMPLVLGHDVAGVVVEVGSGVRLHLHRRERPSTTSRPAAPRARSS